ncbi:hypothetical protein M8818_005535 [Zalaria obscura]|uniref:Uncharacterized protein n=1 Tax=Zalaria obscura TaxID=2024903 RepID=A0ACC3SA31_9PEZI
MFPFHYVVVSILIQGRVAETQCLNRRLDKDGVTETGSLEISQPESLIDAGFAEWDRRFGGLEGGIALGEVTKTLDGRGRDVLDLVGWRHGVILAETLVEYLPVTVVVRVGAFGSVKAFQETISNHTLEELFKFTLLTDGAVQRYSSAVVELRFKTELSSDTGISSASETGSATLSSGSGTETVSQTESPTSEFKTSEVSQGTVPIAGIGTQTNAQGSGSQELSVSTTVNGVPIASPATPSAAIQSTPVDDSASSTLAPSTALSATEVTESETTHTSTELHTYASTFSPLSWNSTSSADTSANAPDTTSQEGVAPMTVSFTSTSLLSQNQSSSSSLLSASPSLLPTSHMVESSNITLGDSTSLASATIETDASAQVSSGQSASHTISTQSYPTSNANATVAASVMSSNIGSTHRPLVPTSWSNTSMETTTNTQEASTSNAALNAELNESAGVSTSTEVVTTLVYSTVFSTETSGSTTIVGTVIVTSVISSTITLSTASGFGTKTGMTSATHTSGITIAPESESMLSLSFSRVTSSGMPGISMSGLLSPSDTALGLTLSLGSSLGLLTLSGQSATELLLTETISGSATTITSSLRGFLTTAPCCPITFPPQTTNPAQLGPVLYADPSIWSDSDAGVGCKPPCILVLPPSQLKSPTTIHWPPLSTTLLSITGGTTVTETNSMHTSFHDHGNPVLARHNHCE